MSSSAPQPRPTVGVGALVYRDGKILLGKRKNSHGSATWSPPGGHLEWGETPEACAAREVREETGIEIGHCVRGPYTNDIFSAEGKHYITLFVIAAHAEGGGMRLEPEKCEGWEWFGAETLPSPLFLPLANLLKQGFDLTSAFSGSPRHGSKLQA